MSHFTFEEMTRKLGDASGAKPRHIAPLRPIKTKLLSTDGIRSLLRCYQEEDLRNMDAEEMAAMGLGGRVGHE